MVQLRQLLKKVRLNQNIENVYSGLPIRGGERVRIKIKPNTEKNVPLEFDTPENIFTYQMYQDNFLMVQKKFSH